MKWDRIMAYGLVIVGMAYAAYSGAVYVQKLTVVDSISTPIASASQEKPVSETSTDDQKPEWVIIPSHERPKEGEYFAQLMIPKLDLEMPIIEGTDEDRLANGVGHYTKSVLPGEPDNSVLSGHRDTVFRRLAQLKKGDELQVRTKQGVFVYEITKKWITDENDRSVIVPHDEPVLTLTTCYPFTFLGPAPERYVIQSKLVKRM